MQIDNFFQMNDWEINKFLKVIFSLQFSVIGLMVIDALGFNIPFLREFLSIIYLLFVPGILIIRILRLHKLGSVETLLYTVGLSITTLMFLGLLLNTIGPVIGLLKPISLIPLIITISIFVIILSVMSYLRDKDYVDPDFINIMDLMSPATLALLLIPFIVIFGTYLMNWYKINALLILFILLLSLIVILFAYNRISRKLYPLIIYIFSVSILFQTSLISSYVTGFDIQQEYYLANLVITNSFWNSNLNFVVNSMLSVTILAPILSIFSKIDLNWILKIIYTAVLALVPLGLYEVFKNQTNVKIAFLSSFVFISFFAFYLEMIALARQEIAEFFLILLIMVMISRKIGNMTRSFLFIFFGISLAISHYGLAYVYMFSILLVYILLWVSNLQGMQNLINHIFRNKIKFHMNKDSSKYEIISLTFVVFLFVSIIAWNMYTSTSNAFNDLIDVLSGIATTISTQFLNPSSVQSLAVITAVYKSPLHNLSRYITLLTEVFILLGIISILFINRLKIKREYLAFILVNFIILIAAVSVPGLSNAFNSERLYQILLIFLAPAIVIGGLTFIDIIYKIITKKFKFEIKNFKDKSFKLVSLFLIIYLLFNSGLIYELANDNSPSIALNSTLDTASYNEMEIDGANWLNNYGSYVSFNGENGNESLGGVVISDDYRFPLLNKFGLDDRSITNITNYTNVSNINSNLTYYFPYKSNAYFFFGTNNVLTDSVALQLKNSENPGESYVSLDVFKSENEIYDNGGSIIYIFP